LSFPTQSQRQEHSRHSPRAQRQGTHTTTTLTLFPPCPFLTALPTHTREHTHTHTHTHTRTHTHTHTHTDTTGAGRRLSRAADGEEHSGRFLLLSAVCSLHSAYLFLCWSWCWCEETTFTFSTQALKALFNIAHCLGGILGSSWLRWTQIHTHTHTYTHTHTHIHTHTHTHTHTHVGTFTHELPAVCWKPQPFKLTLTHIRAPLRTICLQCAGNFRAARCDHPSVDGPAAPVSNT
jgi:hypothetical protein